MATIDDVSLAIGELKAETRNVLTEIQAMKAEHTALLSDGCPRGKSNTHRLDNLEKRSERKASDNRPTDAPRTWKDVAQTLILKGSPAVLLTAAILMAVYIWGARDGVFPKLTDLATTTQAATSRGTP